MTETETLIVPRLLTEIRDAGFGAARFTNVAAGDEWAIEIPLDDYRSGYLLVTNADGSFPLSVLHSDDEVVGFAIGAYDPQGGTIEEGQTPDGVHYQTTPAVRLEDVEEELPAVVDWIRAYVAELA